MKLRKLANGPVLVFASSPSTLTVVCKCASIFCDKNSNDQKQCKYCIA